MKKAIRHSNMLHNDRNTLETEFKNEQDLSTSIVTDAEHTFLNNLLAQDADTYINGYFLPDDDDDDEDDDDEDEDDLILGDEDDLDDDDLDEDDLDVEIDDDVDDDDVDDDDLIIDADDDVLDDDDEDDDDDDL